MRWLGVAVILMLTAATLSAMTVPEPTPAPDRVIVAEDPTVPALLASVGSANGFVPRRVRIPSLGVDARIIPMGTDAHGAMELPDDPKLLSWWRGSARVGAAKGNIVVAGHVYQRDRGYGALWELAAAQPGDRITVLGRDDRRVKYVVTSVESIEKVDLSPATVFDAQGDHQLVIITCGAYNKVTDHYEDNVIVLATPV